MSANQARTTPLQFAASNPGWALGAFSLAVLSFKIIAFSRGDPATIVVLAGNLSATVLAIQFMTAFFTNIIMWTWLWIGCSRGLGEHSWKERSGPEWSETIRFAAVVATGIWLVTTPLWTVLIIGAILASAIWLVRRKWKAAIKVGGTPRLLESWGIVSVAVLVLLNQTPLLPSEKIVTTDGKSHVVRLVTTDPVNIKGIQRSGGVIDIAVKDVRSRTPCNFGSHGRTLPELFHVTTMTPDC